MIARGEKYCRLGDLLDGADPALNRRPNVEPKQEVEGRPLDLEKGLRPVKAGIVDEDVEPRDGAEGGAHRRAVSDIEWHSLRLAAGRSNFRATSTRSLFVRLTKISWAPATAMAMAMARPLPRSAPVTSATLPSRRNPLAVEFIGLGLEHMPKVGSQPSFYSIRYLLRGLAALLQRRSQPS